ncbi:Bax inhibitor-1/YccA family protein [Helicobacter pylori]
MALYDRANSHNAYAENSLLHENESELVGFVKTTYKFFAGSLLLATIGALLGLMNFQAVVQYKWVFFIAEIAALFGLMFSKSKPGLNLFMLFAFTSLSGVTLVPLLGMVIAKAGLGAIWQALGMTTIVFGLMSVYALKTKNDLANMGKMLFIALIVVLVCSLINLFLGSPMFQVVIAGASAILFSLYIAYDTQNIVKGMYDSPIDAAVSLYLDFLNVFISILQIIGIFSDRDK